MLTLYKPSNKNVHVRTAQAYIENCPKGNYLEECTLALAAIGNVTKMKNLRLLKTS